METIYGVKFMPDTVTAVATENGVVLYVIFDDVMKTPFDLKSWGDKITPVLDFIHHRTSRLVENAPFNLNRVMFTQGSTRSMYSPMMALMNKADKCYQWHLDHGDRWLDSKPAVLESLFDEQFCTVINMPTTNESTCIGTFNKYFGIQEYGDYRTPMHVLLEAAGVDVSDYQNNHAFMKILQAAIEALLVRELALIHEEKVRELRDERLQDIAAAFLPGDIDEHVADLLVELGESLIVRLSLADADEKTIEDMRKFVNRFKQ